MKKSILVVILLITLIGCENISNDTAADVIADQISIGFAEGDDATSVTQNLLLPTETELNSDAVLMWESLNTDVITDDGFVTQQSVDVNVRLVLRIQLNGLYAQRIFDLVVKAQDTTSEIIITVHVFDQTQTFTLSSAIFVRELNAPTIEGYVFIGWLNEEKVLLSDDDVLSESLTLTASFEAIVTVTYTIDIYEQSLSEQYELVSTVEYIANEGETISYVPTKDGFILNPTSVTSIVLSETNNALTIYLDREVFNVSFYTSGGLYQTVTYLYESQIIPPVLSSEVIGWSLTQEGASYNFETPVTEDVTLYALYEASEVTYTGYYSVLDSVSDANIYNVLQTLIQDYRFVSYDDARDILQISDEDPNNPNNVILVYNRDSVRSTWDSGATWNREHVWPRSKLPNTTSESDTHNLKPADPVINSTRGNDSFAVGTGTYGRVSGGWFPGEEDKGDIARIVMYVAMMWEANISLVGNINTFLLWHEADPVDDFEMNRNDVLFQYTEHRNPFIDHPELAYRIYGQPSNAPFYLQQSKQVYDVYNKISNELWIEKNTSI